MLADLTFDVQSIVDNDGIGIAVTGIAIVFVALVAVTLFIAALPRVLKMLEGVLPPEREHHPAVSMPTEVPVPDDSIAVAIGFALHSRQRKPG